MELAEKLYQEAKKVAGGFALNGFEGNSAGKVGCALQTIAGDIYTGICIDSACSVGFCAEHAAVADMLKDRQTQIAMIVAVTERGNIIPPCGRCREMLVQVDSRNMQTQVIIAEDKIVPLSTLLPNPWAEVF